MAIPSDAESGGVFEQALAGSRRPGVSFLQLAAVNTQMAEEAAESGAGNRSFTVRKQRTAETN